VGESERAVRQVFTRARSSVPCVLFFDELDALVPKRDDSASEASSRVVNTLLTELDGLSSREGIFVVAATNRPEIIDPAMLRPGRLESLVYVGLPTPAGRVSILRTLMKKIPIDSVLAERGVGSSFDRLSGADLASLVRMAGSNAIDRDSNADYITEEDFMKAAEAVKPSVTDIGMYERMRERLARG
jgi:ribosome biogenesis ATPase